MKECEKIILKDSLNKAYKLLKEFDDHKKQGSTAYQIIYELENINIFLDIPFRD